MLQNLHKLNIFCNFASEFGYTSKFGHKKRAFCSLPKCRSLETFYNGRKSVNDRCVSVFANLYGPPFAVCDIHGVGHYFSFIAKWFSRAWHLVNERYPHALQIEMY